MNSENYLKTLLKTTSVSGHEFKAVSVYEEYMKQFSTKVLFSKQKDNIGNSIFSVNHKKDQKKIMISGHIDEIGLQVQYITNEGFIKVIRVGGVDLKTLPGSKVIIYGKNGPVMGIIGKEAIHTESDRNSIIPLKNLKIDIGVNNKEDAESLVEIGDPITFYDKPIFGFGKDEKLVISKGLDDKIGVFITSEVLKKLSNESNLNSSIYGVAMTQEEVGLRGAMVLSKNLNPDISIDIDVTFATDDLYTNYEEYGDVQLGKGCVICFGPDKSSRLCKLMKSIAKEKEIKHQVIATNCGGTNTCVIQENSFNCETVLISIPIRNMHTQVEMINMDDVNSAIDLIYNTILKLNKI